MSKHKTFTEQLQELLDQDLTWARQQQHKPAEQSPEVQALITSAAEAQEVIPIDELEEYVVLGSRGSDEGFIGPVRQCDDPEAYYDDVVEHEGEWQTCTRCRSSRKPAER